jgi:hypothetical protein
VKLTIDELFFDGCGNYHSPFVIEELVRVALAEREAENARLRGALKQIDRMHLMPDDKINRTTHAMALVIARRALGGEP